MYKQHVLDHYGKPYHCGLLPVHSNGTVSCGEAVSDVCGDRVTIDVRFYDSVLIDIWWQGEGCCFSQAAASMLAEHMEGMVAGDIAMFTDADMFNLFQAECPDARRDCVLVALTALRQLTEQIP